MSYYPDRTYPDAPQFPAGHEDVPWGPDLYTAVSSYIYDMVTDVIRLIDREGNIEVAADKGIKFDSVERIALTGGEIAFTALNVATELIVDTPTFTTLTMSGDLIVGNDVDQSLGSSLTIGGTVTCDYIDRTAHSTSQQDEPGDPADNTAVIWTSSGVGYGDIGDVCCKITEGGGTTSFTIADYSGL